MKKANIISLITLIIAGGGGFYAGIKYQQKKNPQEVLQANFQDLKNLSPEERQQRMKDMEANVGNFAGRNGGSANPNRGGGFINGEILSKDDKSITVKVGDTGSKIIFFSGSTTISKSQTGSKDDLMVGGQVIINGQTNSDGSIAAQNVQIR